jgi:hypothetical protein
MGHVSHSKKMRWRKPAARAVLVLGIVLLIESSIDFIYHAETYAECSATASDLLTWVPWLRPSGTDCDEGLQAIERHLRLDAMAAMVGILLACGAGIPLSKFRRRTKRLLVLTEVAFVVVGTVYTALLFTVLR